MNNPAQQPQGAAPPPQPTAEEQAKKADAQAFVNEVYNNQMRIQMPSGSVMKQLDLVYADWFQLCEKYQTFKSDNRAELLQCVHKMNTEGINWRHCPPLFAIIKFGNAIQVVELIYYWRVRAAMTGQYAGKDPARYSERQITVQVGQKQVVGPEWCEMDIYRLVGGARMRFSSGRIMFEKAVNAGTYWVQQPYDMMAKRAEASALRQAFPNSGEIDWDTYQRAAEGLQAMLGGDHPTIEDVESNAIPSEYVESNEVEPPVYEQPVNTPPANPPVQPQGLQAYDQNGQPVYDQHGQPVYVQENPAPPPPPPIQPATPPANTQVQGQAPPPGIGTF